jgi:hypothetical protein
MERFGMQRVNLGKSPSDESTTVTPPPPVPAEANQDEANAQPNQDEEKKLQRMKAIANSALLRFLSWAVYNVLAHICCMLPKGSVWNWQLAWPMAVTSGIELLYGVWLISCPPRSATIGDRLLRPSDSRISFLHPLAHLLSGIIGFGWGFPGANLLPAAAALPGYYWFTFVQNLFLDKKDRKAL